MNDKNLRLILTDNSTFNNPVIKQNNEGEERSENNKIRGKVN